MLLSAQYVWVITGLKKPIFVGECESAIGAINWLKANTSFLVEDDDLVTPEGGTFYIAIDGFSNIMGIRSLAAHLGIATQTNEFTAAGVNLHAAF